jgi:hypothetical protein
MQVVLAIHKGALLMCFEALGMLVLLVLLLLPVLLGVSFGIIIPHTACKWTSVFIIRTQHLKHYA